MGTKSENAKQKIMAVARHLFATKGYSAVTMQDICLEAELSRGGLYRYYGSTEEIFAAIIESEQKTALQELAHAKAHKITPDLMMASFLRIRLEDLLRSDVAYDNAVSEFAANSEMGKALLAKRAETSVVILREMIEAGCETGDFSCDDPAAAARQILWAMEGMAKHHALLPVTDEEIGGQVALFAATLGAKKPLLP